MDHQLHVTYPQRVHGRPAVMNGPRHSEDTDSSRVDEQPALAAANETLAQLRLSFDSSPGASSFSPHHVNGFADVGDDGETTGGLVQMLKQELGKAKMENEVLTSKYNTLVTKLTAMRTSVESKLKRDAEELDRREQEVQQLTVQNDDYVSTIETLKEELIQSNAAAERSSRELEAIRARAFHDSAQEVAARERDLAELQSELERCRIERDEHEHALMTEKIVSEEARAELTRTRRELELEKKARMKQLEEMDKEKENNSNLQSVLDDFQTAREYEIRQAVRELESQLRESTQSLAEYKSRALRAEVELQESSTTTQKTAALEKDIKEKNLLIGKLRHEAVILNEHLTEAIRRLRKDASDNNVDRRLVTNVIISFLTTPRGDNKRYEMLSLLASVLQWTDAEREKAGLQRSLLSSKSSNKGKLLELEKTDETESFSKMWVEFLLKEAGQGSTSSSQAPATSPKSPSVPNSPRLGNFNKTARIASYAGTSLNERSSIDSPRSPIPRS